MKWNENDIGILLQLISETKSIDNDIDFWVSRHNKHNNEQGLKYAEFCWNQVLILLPKYVAKLENLIAIFEKNKSACYSIVQSIKTQIANC